MTQRDADNTRQAIGQAFSTADTTKTPVCAAIVWCDTRAQSIIDRIAVGDPDRLKQKTGLPLATSFSASKIARILENVDRVREHAEAGELAFGTTDTWAF